MKVVIFKKQVFCSIFKYKSYESFYVPSPFPLPPREAKAISLQEALSWTKSLSLSQVVVEIYAEVMFDALNAPPVVVFVGVLFRLNEI